MFCYIHCVSGKMIIILDIADLEEKQTISQLYDMCVQC